MNSEVSLFLSFIVYSAAIILIGLYSARWRKKTTDDFVLANRELGPWVSALSASASSESGWVMLGLVGEAYLFGVAAFWIVPGIAAGYLFNWLVIAEKLRQKTKEYGAVTVPQYLSYRFGKKSKALLYIPVIIITISMLGYVAAQMNAAGKAFEAVFSLPYWLGVLAVAFIILTYTVTGGFRAICWTDVVQASFMVIALIFMPLIMLGEIGGYSVFLASLKEVSPDLLNFSAGKTGFVMLGFIVGLLGIGLGYPGQPQVLSRFMAARDKGTITQGGVIALVWMVLVYVGAVFFGLFSRVHYGSLADPEQALPLACSELLPPIIGGFVIAAIVAAICSTADSQLIVVSSTISRDIFARGQLDKPEMVTAKNIRYYQRLDRLVLVGLAVLAIFFALTENRVIFHLVLYAWGVMGAAFGPVVILGLLWKRANKAGAIAGLVTGSVVAVIWREVAFLKNAVYELVPAFMLAFLAVIFFSLLTPREDDKKDGN
ncbi:MAG: sodium/proline symporter [candidate division Zixibacteria bacterium]|nr:sodium/proline symporter [candidate division Zixibacteria bacterium]